MVPLLAAVCLTVWPVTIGIAVLRYRLYDVDLVISKTFTYLLLTVVLAVVYAGTVVVLGATGSVGMVAVQTAKVLGAGRVVGRCGSQTRCPRKNRSFGHRCFLGCWQRCAEILVADSTTSRCLSQERSFDPSRRPRSIQQTRHGREPIGGRRLKRSPRLTRCFHVSHNALPSYCAACAIRRALSSSRRCA